jgi:16S rRNA (guanine527-N7)-methyltransferase
MPGAPPPLATGYRDRISAVAERLGASLAEATIARIAVWFDLLAAWNAKIDLTAARNPDELADLMLADALVIARHEPKGATVVDIGSGAGGPGLGIYLVRPDLHVTLVEPLQKRVAFLRTAAAQAGGDPFARGSLTVLRARGEVVAARASRFGSAVSRATFAPDTWLELAARLVAPGGGAWVLLAREPPPAPPGWEISVDESYEWPLTRAKRRALRYKLAT